MILEMIKKYDAVIIGEICGINTYQVRLKKAYNLSELSEIINELESVHIKLLHSSNKYGIIKE